MVENRNYIPQLTFFRFLAAITVVIFHYSKSLPPYNSPYISNFFDNGDVAVSFFFFLSGLVLCVSYWNKRIASVKDFWLKRFARIYPVYLLAFAMTVGFSLIGGSPIDFVSAIFQFFTLHAWIPKYALDINFTAWSISVEILFYALFPFLILYFKKHSISHLVWITAILYLLSIGQYSTFDDLLFPRFPNQGHEVNLFINLFPLWHLNTFVFGILAGRVILIMKDQNKTYSIPPVWWWLTASIMLFFILNTDNLLSNNAHNGLLAPLFFIVCLGLSLDTSFIVNWLSAKPLVYLGNVSYAVYLLQFPALILFLKIFKQDGVTAGNFIYYFLFLIVLSCVIYSIYEKKCREIILKIFARKKA